ncbi:glutamate and aspartate ABC transporter periplasmic-binding protein [Cupriavidus sp. HMR-1]|uniref:amino acid ABC transporter substrate-binding protein n=1 Tax=Cupriavidus sp. HMR-1 TaxID=1249621 RepID=UPI0002A2E365|nr:amino acid ABC transporter substrate-binding protein [Cupriavidus sp. HMR-1]EKZ96579.1 glutamate and aspartate ABC transporter periplasmic-binding protein [Cupriavidus sp. HMR-1]
MAARLPGMLAALWLGLVATFGATLAVAQDATVLSGTLKKARDTGTLVIGYRESSLPFSYLNQASRPIGYSIDICTDIVQAASEEVGRELAVKWVPVTSENRFEAITSGRIDLECGSTTRNAERMQTVAFSPVIFIAGTKLMVPRASPIKSFRDLKGKTVVVTAGTTNEQAVAQLSKRFDLNINLIRVRDHADAFAVLSRGGADAYAGDDVLLYGFLAHYGAGKKFIITRDFISYDPYGIMLRKNDPQFATLVGKAVRDVITSGDMERLYKQWFMNKLPTGERLGIPMSAELEGIIDATPERPE